MHIGSDIFFTSDRRWDLVRLPRWSIFPKVGTTTNNCREDAASWFTASFLPLKKFATKWLVGQSPRFFNRLAAVVWNQPTNLMETRYRSRVMVLHTSYDFEKDLSRCNHHNCLFWKCPPMIRSTSPASFSLSRSSFSSHFQPTGSPWLLCKGSTNPTAGLVATVLTILNGGSWKLLAPRGTSDGSDGPTSAPNVKLLQRIRWFLFVFEKTQHLVEVEVTKRRRRDVAGIHSDKELGWAKLREEGVVGPLLLHNLQGNNKLEVQLNPMYFVIPWFQQSKKGNGNFKSHHM